MADKTLVKALPRAQNVSNFTSNTIDLFGAKSESENILSIIEKVIGLTVFYGDGFPSKICRNCFSRLKQFAEFKDLCLKSRLEQQEALVGIKRGKRRQKVHLQGNNGKLKADLHGTTFAYDCRMRFFYSARCSRYGKIVYDFHDIKLPTATIVVGF